MGIANRFLQPWIAGMAWRHTERDDVGQRRQHLQILRIKLQRSLSGCDRGLVVVQLLIGKHFRLIGPARKLGLWILRQEFVRFAHRTLWISTACQLDPIVELLLRFGLWRRS